MRVQLPEKFIELGEALDVVVDRGERRGTLRWSKAQVLATDASKQVLYIYPARVARRVRFRADVPELREAARVVRLWKDFEPREVKEHQVRLGATWIERGQGVRIGYHSDKWTGRGRSYEHDFEARPRVLQNGELYRISGGFRVTARGIVG